MFPVTQLQASIHLAEIHKRIIGYNAAEEIITTALVQQSENINLLFAECNLLAEKQLLYRLKKNAELPLIQVNPFDDQPEIERHLYISDYTIKLAKATVQLQPTSIQAWITLAKVIALSKNPEHVRRQTNILPITFLMIFLLFPPYLSTNSGLACVEPGTYSRAVISCFIARS